MATRGKTVPTNSDRPSRFTNRRGAVRVENMTPNRKAIAAFLGDDAALNDGPDALIPGTLWPQMLTVEYPEALPEWGNLVRSTLMVHLETKRMMVQLEKITSNDLYIATLKQLFRKRLRTVPLNQDTPASTTFSLSVTNLSQTKSRVVYMRDFTWTVKDRRLLPKDWPGPFLVNLPFAKLRPNTSLHMTDITVDVAREIDSDRACHSSVCTCVSHELDEEHPDGRHRLA